MVQFGNSKGVVSRVQGSLRNYLCLLIISSSRSHRRMKTVEREGGREGIFVFNPAELYFHLNIFKRCFGLPHLDVF